MAYNRRYLLQRIIEVQDIVKANISRGVSQKHTYYNEIAPRFHISWSAYNRWLSYPAEQELKRDFADVKRPEKVQLTLW
jgi:hypothetical protein